MACRAPWTPACAGVTAPTLGLESRHVLVAHPVEVEAPTVDNFLDAAPRMDGHPDGRPLEGTGT
ncbi:MAG: hypothetical protein IT449_07490 [Phycisphaerales bacterium]|nr:hypothetical protein [Phycisphaerales bacterium]